MKKLLLILSAFLLLSTNLFADIPVTASGSGLAASYPSLADAITALNAATITTPVVITLSGNETAPAGGYSITAIGTATNTITISGISSTITAFTPQATGLLNDAIFKITGGDYITIQGFILQENPANTTTAVATNNMTEWGVALLYFNTTNGAQYNTIQNNTISLNRTYLNTFGIYSNTRHSATVVTTSAEVTSAAGSNSFNKVYGNTISNVNFGIVFIGAGTAIAAIDNGNDIGGNSAGTGNTITNWGGGGAPTLYISLTANNYCIFMNQQINDNVSFNAITSAALTNSVATGGILKNYSVASPASGPITTTINSNTVTVTNNPSAATTGSIIGINNQGLTPLLATATMSMNNNTVQNCVVGGSTSTSNGITGITNLSLPGTLNINGNSVINNSISATTATSGIVNGISNSGAAGTVNINNNIIRGFASTATTGQIQGITNSGAVVTALNINNNQLGNNTGGFFSTSTATSGTLFGVSNSGGASTCDLSIQQNDIRGITYSAVASAAQSYFQNTVATKTQNISNNTFTSINVYTTGGVTFISNAVSLAASGTMNINSNSVVNSFNKGGAGGTVTGFSTNASSATGSAVNMTNNYFVNITVTGATSFVGINNTDGGSPTKTITGNTFNNISGGTSSINPMTVNFLGGTSSVSNNTITNISWGATITALTIGGSSTATTLNVTNNTINTISSTAGGVVGLSVASPSTTTNVGNNNINTLSSTAASAVTGISISGATTTNLFKNKIYNLSGSNASSTVNGILVGGGTTINVFNNLIGDLRTPAANAANPLVGLSITGGTTVNAYYNTVYLSGSSTGGLFGSSAVSVSTTPAITLRNNIFYNSSIKSGSGLSVAYRRSSTTLTTYAAASNNNDFFASPIYTDGTNTDATIAAYKTRVASRDAASFYEDPEFQNTTGSSADFLKYKVSTAKQIESGAINIATYTDDFAGTVRFGNPGYVVCSPAGTAPDIGAWELCGIAADLTAPAISSISFAGNACNLTSRNVTATINDASGVDNTTNFAPRIYFRKNGGTYFSAQGAITSGTVNSGTWTFTITYSTLSGVAPSDIIDYFIVAQDVPGNAGGNPGGGLVLTNVNTVTTPPTVPLTYTILISLSGSYDVGSGKTYPTLTAAINAYNTSCLAGSVTFLLTDAAYTEAAPMTINANFDASAANTLTIKPSLANTTIGVTGGSSTAILILNGADYVIIDGYKGIGENTVCFSSNASRDLTITNANSGTSSAVVWLQTAGTDGATNNTIKNCNIAGYNNTTTLIGIGSGSSAIGTTSLGTGNNSNSIINNNISKTQFGIYSQGASAANKNTGTIINQNLINTAAPDNVSKGGIQTGFENNIIIDGNAISGIRLPNSPDVFGIALGLTALSSSSFSGNEVTNATVRNNIIGVVTNTGTFSAGGITLAAAASGTTLIANNMISGVNANGTSGDFAAGIILGGGAATTNVYYNSVTATGTFTGGTYPSYALAVTGSNPILNIKNNIFTSTGSTGANLNRAMGFAYAAFSNLVSNNNDLFASGTNSAVVQTATLASTGGTTYTAVTGAGSWNAASLQDANSKNMNPVFTTNALHIDNTNANNFTYLNGTAATGTGISDDIDCEARDASTPDIGADEFTTPPCNGADGGTASGSTTFCGSGTPAITAINYSTGIGSTYQWMYSTSPGDYPDSGTPVDLQTNPSLLTTGMVSVTTYYWLRVTCSTNTSTANSTLVTITVNPSEASITGPSAKCANDPPVTLAENGNTGTSWVWSDGSTTQAISVNPPATTTYTVTVTSPGSCTKTASKTLLINQNPTGVDASSSVPTACSGVPFNLFSTADIIPGFAQNFDGVTSPALPSGWTSSDPAHWMTSNLSSVSSPNAAFASDPASVQDRILESPSISIIGTSATLTFKQSYVFEGTSIYFDGGVLEISIDGGAYQDILAAGCIFNGGGYVGTISSSYGNPLGGRQAWVGNSNGFLTTTVNLPASLAGHSIRLRWRLGSDTSTGDTGWYIDDIAIADLLPLSYSWASEPSGYSSPVQNPTGVTQTVATKYTVTVTGVGGCATTDFVNVGVFELPTPSISGDLEFCQGGSTTLDAGDFSGYIWSTGATTKTISVNAAATYAVTVTDANGCKGSNSVTTTINPLPDVPGSPHASFIAPSSFVVNWTYGGGSTPTNYTVEVATDNLFNDDVPGSPFTVPYPGTSVGVTGLDASTTYFYRITASNVCTGPPTATYSVVTLCPATVAPFVEDFETGGFAPACWTNNPISGSYVWEGSNTVSAYGKGTRSALANFWNQSFPASYEMKTKPFSISGLTTPTLKFNYAYASYVVEIDELDIYYSTDYGETWAPLLLMPGGPLGILNTAGVSESPFVPTATQWCTQSLELPAGTNRLKFTAISAYGNNLYLDNIRVSDPEPENITLQNSTVLTSLSYTATNTITVEGPVPSLYTVSDGASLTLVAGTKINLKPGTSVLPGGYLHASIFSDTYCNQSPELPAAIAENDKSSPQPDQAYFTLYPNPTNGNFTLVQKGGRLFDNVTVEIYSMRGEKVLIYRMTGEKMHEFSVAEVPAGVYFVKIIGDGYTETIKLVRTR